MRELKLLQGETICAKTGIAIDGIIERDGNLATQRHTLDLSDWAPVHKRHVQRLLCQSSATGIKGLKADNLPALDELADITVSTFPALEALELSFNLDLDDEDEPPSMRFLQSLPVLTHLRLHVIEGESAVPNPLDRYIRPLASNLRLLTLDLREDFPSALFESLVSCKLLQRLSLQNTPHEYDTEFYARLPPSLGKLDVEGCLCNVKAVLLLLADGECLGSLTAAPIFEVTDSFCPLLPRGHSIVRVTSEHVKLALAGLEERPGIRRIPQQTVQAYRALVNERLPTKRRAATA